MSKLKILSIFNKTDPIVLGAEVISGTIHVGMCLSHNNIYIGFIESMECNTQIRLTANCGDFVAIKIIGEYTNLIVGMEITSDQYV